MDQGSRTWNLTAVDVVDHTSRQAITAVGSSCHAVLAAERHLATPVGPDLLDILRSDSDEQEESAPSAAGAAGQGP